MQVWDSAPSLARDNPTTRLPDAGLVPLGRVVSKRVTASTALTLAGSDF